MKLFTPREFEVTNNAYHINGKEYVYVNNGILKRLFPQ